MTVAPRVEIFNRLSCNSQYDAHTTIPPHPFHQSLPDQFSYPDTSILRFANSQFPPTLIQPSTDNLANLHWGSSHECISDPVVQRGTSRLQMIVTTIGGVLSALSTGYWSRHGERHGRTNVLAIATFGLLLAFVTCFSPLELSHLPHRDIISLLAYSPRSHLSVHGHKLIFLAPFVEGILGGWPTLHSAVIMYISDSATSQSHMQILSKYQGLFYLGFILGPALGTWLIRHPFVSVTEMEKRPADGVTSVFCIAIACSLVNLFLMLFVYPESSVPAKRKANPSVSMGEEPQPNTGRVSKDVITHFRSHMSIFMPKRLVVMNRLQADWSLTVLACVLFGYLLSTAVMQVRYLYAEYMYGWDVGQVGIRMLDSICT
jgi:MFS family permease